MKIHSPRPTLMVCSDAEALAGITHQRVSKWRRRLKEPEKYREMLYGPSYHEAMAEKTSQRGASGTGENEWYTPSEYLQAARDVLGEIDLDPASSDKAQERVQAKAYFTQADDGLIQKWHGRVWLNPPYAQPYIAEFVSKLADEVANNSVHAAILLTHNYTDTAWFHLAESNCEAICFTRGRIKFIDARGAIAAPTQGQAFFYYGENGKRFREVFADFGFIR